MGVKSANGNKMRKAYGERICDMCSGCCNFQPKQKDDERMICIGFSNKISWNQYEMACGLYNRAFLGIRPRLYPLNEMIEVREANMGRSPEGEQSSLFDFRHIEEKEEDEQSGY